MTIATAVVNLETRFDNNHKDYRYNKMPIR